MGNDEHSKYIRNAAFQIMLGVALVMLCSGISWADSSSDTIIVYGQSGNSSPRYRVWGGSSWGGEQTMPSVGATPNWIVLSNCPTRDEFACVTYDSSSDFNILFRTNGSWGSVTQICSDGGNAGYRKVDVAYESQSGDMLVAYWDYGGGSTNKIGYRTYNGSSLSSEQHLTLPSTNPVALVRLVPSPTSNQILLFATNTGSDLYSAAWNGSSWSGVSTLEGGVSDWNSWCYDAAWESSGDQAVVVYGEDGYKSPRTQTWDGSSWSGESSMSSIGSEAKVVRIASDPESDNLVVATLDGEKDIYAFSWNGSSWSGSTHVESETRYSDRLQFDVAFEAGTGDAIICYEEKGGNTKIQYRTWNGSGWSNEKNGPKSGDDPVTIQVVTGPESGEVMLGLIDKDTDLACASWTGSSFGSYVELETNAVSQSYECFMICGPTAGAVSVSPADVPYFTDFESGVGPEWNSTTTETNATLSTFLGRFNKTPVSIELNTVIGETYTLEFNLYAIDSWNPSGTTTYDAFAVQVDGADVFEESFSQRTGSYPPTFPNPPESQGNYGYSSSYEEGVYDITVSFVATLGITKITFVDTLDEDLSNESTGIDNVSVGLSRFHDVTSAKGFDVQTTTGSGYGSGLNWADYDNDGDLDVIITGNSSSRRIINNSQGVSFTASTFGTGSERRQGAMLDVDNDGDVDFWSGNNNSYYVEACYQNDGSAGFSDVGNLGYGEPNNNEGVAAADVNRDGWCDIVHFSENANWFGEHQGDPGKSPTVTILGSSDTNIGMNDSGDVGNGDYCSSGDVNNDGYLDFFYHWSSGKLFLSKDSMSFIESLNGISVVTGENDKMGSAWGDYDNDGDLDLFVARHDTNYTGYLWRNDVTWSSPSSGSFTNQTANAYVLDESGQRSCAWGDFDNDGDLDLYVVTHSGVNRLYANHNDGTFRLVDEGAEIDGNGHDAVFVDYDNDGDLDLAMTRESSTAVLLENRTNNSNYLKVRLIGAGSGATNVAAIGVRVELWDSAGSTRLGRRDIGVARGYGGTEPLWAHFGGVDPSTTYKLKVWFHSRDNSNPLEVSVVPGSVSTTIGSKTIPQMITIEETNAKKKIIQWREVPNRA